MQPIIMAIVLACAPAVEIPAAPSVEPSAVELFLQRMREHSRSRPGELVHPVCGVERVCKDNGRA